MLNIAIDKVEKYYYENGKIEGQCSFQNRELNGPCKGWHESGDLSFEGNWLKNKKHGIWSHYDKEGNVNYEYWLEGKEIIFNHEYAELMIAFLRNFRLKKESVSPMGPDLLPKTGQRKLDVPG